MQEFTAGSYVAPANQQPGVCSFCPNFARTEVFGRLCSTVFLAFTLKLSIHTLLCVASRHSVFWHTTQYQQNEHTPRHFKVYSPKNKKQKKPAITSGTREPIRQGKLVMTVVTMGNHQNISLVLQLVKQDQWNLNVLMLEYPY